VKKSSSTDLIESRQKGRLDQKPSDAKVSDGFFGMAAQFIKKATPVGGFEFLS
jgi:hypothetical protein